MPNNEEPIFDFSPLKRFLERRGYKIRTRDTWVPVKPEDVKPEDVTNGTMEFRDDGIFVIDRNGQSRQVFLYKKPYKLQQFGKPRFHICKCGVIEDFIIRGRFRQNYVRSNTEPVPVNDMDDGGKEKMISGLPLCRFCQDMISDFGSTTTTQFVELLKAANGGDRENEDLEKDIFGYTRDWDFISKEYREKHEYTCENCGLKIEDDYDRQYIHVHHINGDKLDNKESNLKCLCLYCHAHVDAHHERRLMTGANKVAYYSFVDRYCDEGCWDIDDETLEKIRRNAEEINRGNMQFDF